MRLSSRQFASAGLLVLTLAQLLLSEISALAEDYVLPYKPDPPIVVDAQLDDWVRVPSPIQLKQKPQVTFGPALWARPEDLSGEIRLAWRDGGLLVAAEVQDDKIIQSYTGRDLWRGDHVCVWLDMVPSDDPERENFGKGQCTIGLSPGNLQPGTPKRDPEIFVFRPEDAAPEGGQIASRRTETGYIIEAFIPFNRLDIKTVLQGQDAAFEVGISDADSSPAKQC
jgi:hypothetical protein